MNLLPHEIDLLIRHLPKDKNGYPILPFKQYKTSDGVKCQPRLIIDYGVTVSDGNRFRTCTENDVELVIE